MTAAPRVLLLFGDDAFAMQQNARSLQAELGSPTEAEMNTQRFDGHGLSPGDLRAAVSVIPFLAPRRLVIVDRAGQMAPKAEAQAPFLEILEDVPDTTMLLLLDPIAVDRRDSLERYQRASFLYRWVAGQASVAQARAVILPKGRDFAAWVGKRAGEMGGTIQPAAALMLSELVAGDPYAAELELGKLLDYVDRRRPVDASDVEDLSAFHGESKVFAMVDAVGQRNARLATQLLHRLLEDDDPEYAFAMILRQFRLMLIVREALDLGRPPRDALAGQLPFIVDKLTAQARNFRMADLEQAYHSLASIDLARKSNQQDMETALYTLIATVAG
jgi:DNA polymerase-3 subunit delta